MNDEYEEEIVIKIENILSEESVIDEIYNSNFKCSSKESVFVTHLTREVNVSSVPKAI